VSNTSTLLFHIRLIHCNFRHDSSITIVFYVDPRHNTEYFIEKVSNRAASPSVFLSEVVLQSLLALGCGKELDHILNTCQKLLRAEGLKLPDPRWSCLSRPQVLQHLLDLGAPIEKTIWGNTATVLLMWNSKIDTIGNPAFVDMLSILIKHDISIHHLNRDGLTPSMVARYEYCWAEWCESLERNSFRIEDVLEKEGNTWLLEDNWEKVWIERRHSGWKRLKRISDEDESYFISSAGEGSSGDGKEEEIDGDESEFLEDNDHGTILPAGTYTESNDEANEDYTTEHMNDIITSEIVSMLAQTSE
jgi:hypothetical protein